MTDTFDAAAAAASALREISSHGNGSVCGCQYCERAIRLQLNAAYRAGMLKAAKWAASRRQQTGDVIAAAIRARAEEVGGR